MVTPTDPCPCGSSGPFGSCCLAIHHGEPAQTAEQLMRSRYSAYAVGNLDYVWQTWHPATRPVGSMPDAVLPWVQLDIVDTVDGGPDDEYGEVEYRAHYRDGTGVATLHERSRFIRRAGRWFYEDGDILD
ncbi:MAG: YchJ family metal-binding protein [Mycobacterium sp.]